MVSELRFPKYSILLRSKAKEHTMPSEINSRILEFDSGQITVSFSMYPIFPEKDRNHKRPSLSSLTSKMVLSGNPLAELKILKVLALCFTIPASVQIQMYFLL